MNQLLQNYAIQVNYPDVSGAEHLETLEIRDRLAGLEANFTTEDQAILVEADRKLMTNTAEIYRELSQFIDLVKYRTERKITPEKWWWYLDVLNYLPTAFSQVKPTPIAQRDLKSA
jgi:hypothetical protein